MEEHRLNLTPAMRRIVACILFCASAFSTQLSAQSIRMVRTDVDSGRASFITATQLFGVDIVVSGVKNCTGVSFELQYQGSQYVVFSNWKARDLGKKGTFAYDLSDTLSGNGSVHVGALSGTAITDPGVDNPRAVHLDFVVRPNAPNHTPLSFSFVHAQAVTSDSGGRIVPLTSTLYQVVIHGFVDVFPGDADNNGLVDSRDATTVGAFLKQGSGSSNVRGYKREPCSTLWLAQPSLVWDSSKATYADCDGSGDVTLSDNLVVQINFGKLHSFTNKANDIQVVKRQHFAPSYDRVPLRLSNTETLLGAAFEIDVANPTSHLIGFEIADDYTDVQLSLFSDDDNHRHAYLVFGSTDGRNVIHSGIVGNFVFEHERCALNFSQALGATSDGRIFNLGTLSEVNTDESDSTTGNVPQSDFTFDQQNQLIRWSGCAAKLSITNELGQSLMSTQNSSESNIFSLQDLPSGGYFAILQGRFETRYLHFRLIR